MNTVHSELSADRRQRGKSPWSEVQNFILAIACWFGFAPALIAQVDAPPPPSAMYLSSVVQVICRIGTTNRGSRSLGVIVSVEDYLYGEVILTTSLALRHYVDGEDQCWIVDSLGKARSIRHVAGAQNVPLDNISLALIVTDREFANPVWRLPVIGWSDVLSDPANINRISRDNVSPACSLGSGLLDGGTDQPFLTHDCGSDFGLDGAPLVINHDGFPHVVGLNAGGLAGSNQVDGLAVALHLDTDWIATTVYQLAMSDD